MNDDEFLATLMRRFLETGSYVWFGAYPHQQMTIDASIVISDDELARLNEMGNTP